MKPKLYVETTIISYLAADASRDPITAARQLITRQWWQLQRNQYHLVISEAVEVECGRGNPAIVARRHELLQGLSLVRLDGRIMELAAKLTAPGGLPARAATDAIHIAVAAVAGCEFLLTWNFRHIANARIRRMTERILSQNGFTKTIICTPEELS